METLRIPETVAAAASCTSVPDSPPHNIPACEPLPCLISLLHLMLSRPEKVGVNLPPEFCAALVKSCPGEGGREEEDGVAARIDEVSGGIEEGVPMHPLYVHVGAALYRWICSGRLPRNLAPISGINEDQSWKDRMDAWTEVVVTQGSLLLQLWQKVSFQLDVQEPYSSLLRDGHKTVEGRCATDSYKSLQTGDWILVNERFLLQIKELRSYPTFQNMLEMEGLSSVLPGVHTVSEGVKVYRNFYTKMKEQANGVLAIHVVRPKSLKDPVEIISDILNALGMGGLRTLLGMRTTAGTIKEGLPPPTATLIDSFSALNNPDMWKLEGSEVAGSQITVGARALAKHVPRSLDGWWGSISGTEAEKNKLAKSTLQQLMMHTIWMNVHLAPLPQFEIRVCDGYGARWLADGSQFRGFLEPPMEEGYMKKWKH